MKLPRDITGAELAERLRRYGYVATRQTGSHLRLTSTYNDIEHHISIPLHNPLKVGTLNAILRDIASYLDVDRIVLVEDLFGR